MARTDCNFSFFMSYEMKFKAAIRGHYVYKVTCTPILDEVLICKKDNREEAKEYHLHAVGVYKESPDEENLDVIGHVPIELSRVLVGCCFWLLLAASETNSLTVKVCGKRELEVGLVVFGCYRASTNRKKVADILSQEIKKKKERYPYFELDIEQDAVRKPLLVKHEES